MNMEQEIEKLRESIKQDADMRRKKAYVSGTCAVCGSPISDERRSRRSYTCSPDHAFQFLGDYDHSKNSNILRQRRMELMKELPPKKKREPWTRQKASRAYTCDFCTLPIKKGETYEKYTRLPGLDEFFEDYPYESLPYHISCSEFYSAVFQSAGFAEGLDDVEIILMVRAVSQIEGITVSETKKRIMNGELRHLHDKGIDIATLMDEIEEQDNIELEKSLEVMK